MLQKTHQDLHGDAALRPEAIVEPAVWIPDFPGDEPDLEYTDWRDLLFVYSEVPGASKPIATIPDGSSNEVGARTDA